MDVENVGAVEATDTVAEMLSAPEAKAILDIAETTWTSPRLPTSGGTGKTTVAVDAAAVDAVRNLISLATGQKNSTVAEMLAGLGSQRQKALQFLAPYTDATVAEMLSAPEAKSCRILYVAEEELHHR